MRLVALSVLLIGNLFAHQVLAEDVIPQPLARGDCDKAGMVWDDNVNVCGASLSAAAVPEAEGAQTVTDDVAQPLTRAVCDKAGMAWDDNVNVCGASLSAAAVPAIPATTSRSASEETSPITSAVLINIDKASQKMTVSLDGVQQYEWPVSTGLRGYTTPSGNYVASSMNRMWYSKEWDNAPMPHAVFFTKKGHAIHGTYETKKLGRPASHGCVRLAPEHARTLFALVKEKGLTNTQVVLSGDTPGGEARVASPAPRKQPIKRSKKFAYSEIEGDEPGNQRRFGRRGLSGQFGTAPRGFYQQF